MHTPTKTGRTTTRIGTNKMQRDKTPQRLRVFLVGTEIGYIEDLPDSKSLMKIGFNENYLNSTMPQISRSIPKKKTVKSKEVKNFFDNLLPEGSMRKRLAVKHQVTTKTFDLLSRIGHECPGPIKIIGDGKEFVPYKGKITTRPHEEFIKKLKQSQVREPRTHNQEANVALYTEDYDEQMSIPGAQQKFGAVEKDGKLYIPDEGVPSTWIIKPQSIDFAETVANEYFITKLARAIGINAPNCRVGAEKVKFNDGAEKNIEYFAIERYDRVIHKDYIEHIQQEDFCQALGLPRTGKYQVESEDISIARCLELMRAIDEENAKNHGNLPKSNEERFIEAILFNYLIDNRDAHGKNYSILQTEGGSGELAPLYDLMCTSVYLENLAPMKINGEKKVQVINRKDVIAEIGSQWEHKIDEIINRIEDKIYDVIKEIKEEIDSEIYNMILAKYWKTKDNLKGSSPKQ